MGAWQAILLFSLILLNSAYCWYKEPNMEPGRTTIVHLFEWKWNDIAEECETFLGPYGYGGVQVSPPNEHAILWESRADLSSPRRPWFDRYQPVSYILETRSGNESDFSEMVRRCNNAGVRIYVDAVINHMAKGGTNNRGTAGSFYDSDLLRYDAVPYDSEDFNPRNICPTSSGNIENFNDRIQLRDCNLLSLPDLKLSKDSVRQKIADFLNKLIELGVAGFRIDASKHMWPEDFAAILDRVHNLSTNFYPAGTRPFIYQEVIDLGGAVVKSEEYVGSGRVTEFKFGKHLGDVIKRNNQLLRYLRNFGTPWGFLAGSNALVFIDNHDNQRGHGGGGSILTFRQSREYKMATAFMLAWPYGTPRVMSSFDWPIRVGLNGRDENDWYGPPSDEDSNIKDVIRNSDLTCGNGWICEHRWRQIYNMVRFRNIAGFEHVENWWDNGYQQIAFSRGSQGFLAINNENHVMDVILRTGLPEGTYCDIISGNLEDGRCTGRTVRVNSSGRALILINNTWEDPMISIHIEAKL